jgi:hypothetical protein
VWASHADREQVIGTLKAAFVQGRVAKDELEVRAGQALAARTYAELAALTADLPAGLADAVPPRPAVRAQALRPMSSAARAGMWVVIAAATPVGLSLPTDGAAFLVFAPFYSGALAFLGTQTLVSWHEKLSDRRQLPPTARPWPGIQTHGHGHARDPLRAQQGCHDRLPGAGRGPV